MLLYSIYRHAFGADSKRLAADDEVPEAEKYPEYTKYVHDRIEEIKKVPFQEMRMRARDGIELYGRYYHRKDGAPIILMFHGYRSSCLRDAMGAFRFTEECGYNILMVDQRAHRNSEGKSITFGVKERYDCLDWILHLQKIFGEDTKLFLIGLSMGAATVLMASGLELPATVCGIIADCGYSSPKEILQSVIKEMKLPVRLSYFLVRLSARLYGGFGLQDASATEAVARSKTPILFIHGEEDSFVPCDMSRQNFESCVSEKEILIVPGADHGMSYMTDPEKYIETFVGFIKKHLEV